MIVRRKDGYYVTSEVGKNLGGPYPTKAKAAQRLAQVEYFKKQASLKSTQSAYEFGLKALKSKNPKLYEGVLENLRKTSLDSAKTDINAVTKGLKNNLDPNKLVNKAEQGAVRAQRSQFYEEALEAMRGMKKIGFFNDNKNAYFIALIPEKEDAEQIFAFRDPKSLHLTVLYLGMRPQSEEEYLKLKLYEMIKGESAFTLNTHGYNNEPVWVPNIALEPTQRLLKFQKKIRGAFDLGPTSEFNVSYKPHITVGKFFVPKGAAAPSEMEFKKIVLMKTVGKDQYKTIASYPLPNLAVWDSVKEYFERKVPNMFKTSAFIPKELGAFNKDLGNYIRNINEKRNINKWYNLNLRQITDNPINVKHDKYMGAMERLNARRKVKDVAISNVKKTGILN